MIVLFPVGWWLFVADLVLLVFGFCLEFTIVASVNLVDVYGILVVVLLDCELVFVYVMLCGVYLIVLFEWCIRPFARYYLVRDCFCVCCLL